MCNIVWRSPSDNAAARLTAQTIYKLSEKKRRCLHALQNEKQKKILATCLCIVYI